MQQHWPGLLDNLNAVVWLFSSISKMMIFDESVNYTDINYITKLVLLE